MFLTMVYNVGEREWKFVTLRANSKEKSSFNLGSIHYNEQRKPLIRYKHIHIYIYIYAEKIIDTVNHLRYVSYVTPIC